jgi:ribulose-phosphate 3-epimerase
MNGCLLSPSILSTNLSDAQGFVVKLARLGADIIHMDVMDGQFVPPISFGADYVRSLRPCVETPFEAHLMTLTPERHFEAFAEAGCQRILFHVEATHHAHRLVQSLRSLDVSPGIVLNPGTPVEHALELVDEVDMVLVMTVNPGWGGQKFLPGALSKVRRLREADPNLLIEVDGGIDPTTIGQAKASGANVFVVGSYLSKANDLAAAVSELRQRCG